MLRASIAVLACLMLSACSGWVSDERLFSDGDWAHLDINGRYKPTVGGDQTKVRLILKTRPDGLIESRSTDRHDKSRTVTGLVAIKGGSGEYFLSVDRSSDEAESDQYFIVRVSDGKTLEYFVPNCAATPPLEGMARVPGWRSETTADDDALGEAQATSNVGKAKPPLNSQETTDENLVCKFSNKDALMRAGLEAERFLAAKHIVEITPFFALEPDDETGRYSTKRR